MSWHTQNVESCTPVNALQPSHHPSSTFKCWSVEDPALRLFDESATALVKHQIENSNLMNTLGQNVERTFVHPLNALQPSCHWSGPLNVGQLRNLHEH